MSKKNKNALDYLKEKVRNIDLFPDKIKSNKRLNFEELKKLAKDVRETFSDADLKRFEPQY